MPADLDSSITTVPLTQQQATALVAAEPAFRDRELALQQLLTKSEPLVIETGKLTLRVTESGSIVAEMPVQDVQEFDTRLSNAVELQAESDFDQEGLTAEEAASVRHDFQLWNATRNQAETLTPEEHASVLHDAAIVNGLAAQQQNVLRQQELRSDLETEAEEAANTALAPRAIDKAELDELRREAAEQLQREEFEINAASDPEGTYYGLIVADSENFIAQEDADGDVILHDKDKLQTLPGVGERANIGYTARYPKAHVMTDRSKERGDIER